MRKLTATAAALMGAITVACSPAPPPAPRLSPAAGYANDASYLACLTFNPEARIRDAQGSLLAAEQRQSACQVFVQHNATGEIDVRNGMVPMPLYRPGIIPHYNAQQTPVISLMSNVPDRTCEARYTLDSNLAVTDVDYIANTNTSRRVWDDFESFARDNAECGLSMHNFERELRTNIETRRNVMAPLNQLAQDLGSRPA